MYKVFDFREQLTIGQKGEEMFHALYPELTKTSGRKGDFIDPSTGYIVELKSDSYSGSKNFFMEVEASIEPKKPGGPWQALSHDCKYYVYMFVPEKVVYWFLTSELCTWLENHAKDYPVRLVHNKGWAAKGYLVPRASIDHLVVKRGTLE